MADFQQLEELDSEWQTVVSKRRKRRLQIDPIATEDNEARAFWRQNIEVIDADIEPNAEPKRMQKIIHRFGRDFRPIYSMLQLRVDLTTAGLFPEIEEIAADTKTFINFLPPVGNRPVAVEIYGTKNQLDDAKLRIRNWEREETSPGQANRPWARIRSLTEDEKTKNEKKLKKAAEAQEYRRNPPPGKSLISASMGFFEWPKDEANPHEVFGRNLEALDMIRMNSKAYITYDMKTGLFQTIGDKDRAKQAVSKLRATYFQVLAKKLIADTTYLVEPLPKVVDGTIVVLKPYNPGKAKGAHSNRPEVYLEAIGIEDITEENEGSHAAVYERKLDSIKATMRNMLQKTISALPYYRGQIEMRAMLGTFILTRYRQKSQFSLTEFESMMESPQVGGKIIPRTSIVETFNSRSNAFYRIQGDPRLDDHTAKPEFITTLIVSFAGSQKFRLEFVHDTDDSNERPLSSKFSIIDDSETGLIELMELYLVNVLAGSAWYFNAKASTVVDIRKFPRLEKFMDSIKIRDGILSHGSHPLIHIDSMERKELHRYAIAHSLYTCEVAKVEELINSKRSDDNGPAKYKLNRGYENLSLYLTDWNSMFAENAKLEIGQGSTWNPNITIWFPEGIDRKGNHMDGVTAFRDVLKRVEDAVVGEAARGLDIDDLGCSSDSSESIQL